MLSDTTISDTVKEIREEIFQLSQRNDLDSLANGIVRLSSWRFTVGQMFADAQNMTREFSSERELFEKKNYLSSKNIKRDIGENKLKYITDEEAKARAEVASQDLKHQEDMSRYQLARLDLLWQDLKIVIDSIKYKINCLLEELKESK